MQSTRFRSFLLLPALLAGAISGAAAAAQGPAPNPSGAAPGQQRRPAPSGGGLPGLPGFTPVAPGAGHPQPAAPTRPSVPSILMLPDVQAELKITAAQKAALQQVFAQGRADLERARATMEKAPQAEQEKFLAEFRKQHNARLQKALRLEQFERYRQILFQEQGIIAAFGDAGLMKSLGITDEQRAGILELRKREIQQLIKIAQSRGPQVVSNRVRTLRNEGEAKMLARLTDEQRARWQKLLGEPFHGAANR